MTAKADDNRAEKTIIRVDPDIAELIPGFLENRRKDIVAMLDAAQRGDFETVRLLGHSMKGAGGGYGFDAITEIGAALEQAAKQRNAAEIRNRVHELSRYLDRVEVISD
jgi:HPt (histidine-containing phosphotransfer) domain-containing protein